MNLNFVENPWKPIARRVLPIGALFVACALSACVGSPGGYDADNGAAATPALNSGAAPTTAPNAAAPAATPVDPNAFAGHCIWMRGTQVVGQGDVTNAGDLFWTNGRNIVALLGGDIVVHANFTTDWDNEPDDFRGPRLWGLQITGAYSQNLNIATPAISDLLADDAFRKAAKRAAYNNYQARLDQNIARIGEHVCVPPEAYGINGFSGYYGYRLIAPNR